MTATAPKKRGYNVLSSQKVAAKKTGCDLETWRLNREMGLRWCFRCRSWKPSLMFRTDNSRAIKSASQCNPCSSLASKASKYRITVDTARKLIAAGCAICGSNRSMAIDHCHKTGTVRAGLCNRCNVAIGLFRDDLELIKKAINYLEVHNGKRN